MHFTKILVKTYSNFHNFHNFNKKIKYYVDLIPSIIDVYNKELFCIVDNIQSVELDF
jgi:hypothetical protein